MTENTTQKSGAQNFQRRRKLSRTLAMQFIFQLDCRKDWAPDWDHLEDFLRMAVDAPAEDNEMFEDISDDMEPSWKYAEKLIRGVTECKDELDGMITEAAANWTISRMGIVDRTILRIGTYEITRLSTVPPATAINEAVELAKQFGQPESPKFINGVLDKIRKNNSK